MNYQITQEAAEIKAQIEIIEKATGRIVDRAECSFDSADAKASSMLGGNGDTHKYRITRVVS